MISPAIKTTTEIEALEPAEVSFLLGMRELLLIDVREAEEYAAERIADSFLFPLSTFQAGAIPTGASRRVVLYCGSGKRSKAAAEACIAFGFGRVAHLRGGIKAWKDAGLPVLVQGPKHSTS